MNTEVQINLLEIELTAIPPYVLQSCLLVPPIPAPEPEDENVISTPVPPGIEYESLPVINAETQIVDTSPDQLIGCANDLPIGGEQQILNSLFPEAISGDGVVNRDNNDIWTYNGSTWTNVGPTPGPQLVVVSVLPPWNEINVYTAKIRIKLQVQSLPYAPNLLAEPPPIGITIGLRVIRLIPVAKLALAIHAPSIVTDTAVEIPPVIINIQALRPYVQKLRINTPPAVLQLSALAPYANSLRLQVPTAELAITPRLPSVYIPVNVSGITYTQSSAYSGTTLASNAIMTDGSFTNTGAGTDSSTYFPELVSWIKMDLGSSIRIGSIIVGTATSDIPGGWDRAYTANKDLQYCDDNVSWTTAVNTGTFASDGIYTFTVDINARYIRIATISLEDLEVYVGVSEFYALAPGQFYP